MAEQIYYSVFTKKGLELLTEAIRNGTKLGITSMAFGDGGGSLPVPNENFTSMVREVHRTQLNSLAPDPNNANWLRADAIIASATGGFNIRELGLYAGNVLVAYSNYPATYKPNPADGTARIMTFRMILQIDNTANFDLVIDPDVVLATIQKVEDAKLEIYQNTVNTVNTIEDLLKLKVWDGRTVYVQSNVLNDNEDGYFVYDSSKKNINDGGLILNGWIRKGIKKIYLKFFNMLLDGETDETLKLQKLINAAENYNLVNNLRLSIDGLGSVIRTSGTITIDLKKIGCKHFTLKALETWNPINFEPMIEYVSSEATTAYNNVIEQNKLTLRNADGVSRKDKKILGFMFSPPHGTNVCGIYSELDAGNLYAGFVFRENCYLMTFNSCIAVGTHICLTDGKRLGIDANSYGNMGENIRFNDGIYCNSDRLLVSSGWDANFKQSSLDYSGGKPIDQYVQIDLDGSPVLNFTSCHIESGNDNDGFYNSFIKANGRAKVNFNGGTILLSNVNYHNIDHFFYDNSGDSPRGGAEFRVDGTKIFAPAVKKWANKGLTKFTPTINSPESSLFQLRDESTLILDRFFSSANIIDYWCVASSGRTSQFESDRVKIQRAQASDASGLSKNVLKIQKLKGTGSEASVSLYIERPKNSFIGRGYLKLFIQSNQTSAIYITSTLVKSRGIREGYVNEIIEKNIGTITINDVSNVKSENSYFLNGYAMHTQLIDSEQFDYYKFDFNLFSLAENDVVFITEVFLEQCQ